jgi:drug/metabolite transporter (DMT)-like permease
MLMLIEVVAISVAVLFQRLAMKGEDSDPVLSTIIFQLLLGVVLIPFTFIKGFIWPPLSELWPFFLLSTILYAVGSVMIFESVKLIEASEMTILFGMGAIVAMISAYLFLGERLTLFQYLGSILVLLSILLVQYRGKKLVFNRGAILALVSACFFAFATTSDAFIIKNYDAISYASVMTLFPGLMLCLMYPKKLLQLPKAVKTVNKNLIAYTLIYSVGTVTFYTALGKGAMLSQVSIIGKTNIILTVVLAAVFIKERDSLWRKILAALICMVGVILMA